MLPAFLFLMTTRVHNTIKIAPFWRERQNSIWKVQEVSFCAVCRNLSSWLQVLHGVMQHVLRAQNKIAAALLLVKQLFLQRHFLLIYPIFLLFVSSREAFSASSICKSPEYCYHLLECETKSKIQY